MDRIFLKIISVLFAGILLSACAAASESTGSFLYRMGFYKQALNEWRKAADEGDGGAAFKLGAALVDGVVTKRDPKKGVKWLKLGARLGDGRAQYELATLYDNGKGGLSHSVELAADYYLAAARKNIPEAQYNIATMYERGEGVDQNFTEAYKFYTLAIDNDFATFAQPARERLAYKMSQVQIELAKIRVKAFKNNEEIETRF